MLDLKFIRENPDIVKAAIAKKKDFSDIDRLLSLDEKRRAIIAEVEVLKNERNMASEQVAKLKREKQDASELIEKTRTTGEKIKALDDNMRPLDEEINELMAKIPNVPHASVPHGNSAEDNVVVAEWGEERSFDFTPKDHLQLATALDIFDFPRGAKISGSGFPVLKGNGAQLDRALINFFLDSHTVKNGYREVFPPFLVNSTTAFGTGQLPKSKDQMYYMPEDDLYAIPTAEVPVTNLHRDETFAASDLPVKYCAYSACFRREAGTYGKDTKGFLRVHQFNKVELVKFADPDKSYEELETLRADAEGILKALGLKYRVLSLCDADLSFSAAKCYDLEIWAPGEKRWLEVSSCSNFEEFQSRRMNIRYRPEGGAKQRLVHTLNGSGLATARILVGILETYQNADGSITIPEVLRPYMQGKTEIR